MLMRIFWSNGDFYRLNISMAPLSEKGHRERIKKVVGTDCHCEELPKATTKQSQSENFEVFFETPAFDHEPLPEIEILEIIEPPKLLDFAVAWQWVVEQSTNYLSLRGRLRSRRPASGGRPKQFFCHPRQEQICVAKLDQPEYLKKLSLKPSFAPSSLSTTLLKGLAVSFAIFFLSFFTMNYEAYWDIARHSWEESVQPKALQAFVSQPIQNPEISEKIQENIAKQPLLSLFNPKTHAAENSENTLQPAAVTPPDHRLIIPKIGKNVPIVESKADNLYSKNWPELEKELLEDLKRGVVHYPGTALPGQKGNVFLTGHSSYYPWDEGEYKDVFALLGKLEIGDEIVLFYNQKEYRYKVSDIRQVKPDNVEILQQTDDNRLTLMTCTPVGTTLRRLVITALQV